MSDEEGKTITIIVHLPQTVTKVSRLMETMADLWPDVVIDISGPWTIDVPAE
jgi:hypothetical protein